jgi:hypothetical protein
MSNLIFNNLFDKIGDSSNYINTFFDDFGYYNNTIYELLSKLPSHQIVTYFFIILLIYSFISKLNIRTNEILAFLVSCVVIYYLIQKDFNGFIDFTKANKNQLKFLNKIMFDKKYNFESNIGNRFLKPKDLTEESYLYLSPIIINFFYDIRENIKYNIIAFSNTLFHCNNIIGLEYESRFGINRKYYNYEIAVDESKKALNELQSLIYMTPSTIVTYNKFQNSLKILHEILNAYLLRMSTLFRNKNKIEEITIDTKPDNFYDINFFISEDDTHTKNYISTFDLF